MKPYCVISCPIDCYSGYSSRSRDFVKALYELKKDEWDIQILAQRWGNTPWGYIEDHINDWEFLKNMLIPNNQLTRQPDYWYQITVPNEFQPVGKLMNIGVTAGIETTICDPSWIDGINRMNETYVSSEHAKAVFESSSFEERNQNQQVIRQIKLEKPIKVLFEGVDLNKYKFIEDSDLEETELVLSLDEIKEEFNFLIVGHWIKGDIGEDRKNIPATLKLFLETFKDKKNKPGLIIKTSHASCSIMDRDGILEKISKLKESVDSKDLPNIYLLYGDLSDNDMNNLYNHQKVKAMISLTKGEGFGRPLLEFSISKKPIIVSGWSGQMDFLSTEFVSFINGELRKIHPSAVVEKILVPESSWFTCDYNQARNILIQMYEKYNSFLDNAKRQAFLSKDKFSFDKMKEKIQDLVKDYPKPIMLQLPKLKKIELPKLNKIN